MLAVSVFMKHSRGKRKIGITTAPATSRDNRELTKEERTERKEVIIQCRMVEDASVACHARTRGTSWTLGG